MNQASKPATVRNPFECMNLMGYVQHWITDLTTQLQTQGERIRHVRSRPGTPESSTDLEKAVQLLDSVQILLFNNKPASIPAEGPEADSAQDAQRVAQAGLREFESMLDKAQHLVGYARALLADAAIRLDRVEAARR